MTDDSSYSSKFTIRGGLLLLSTIILATIFLSLKTEAQIPLKHYVTPPVAPDTADLVYYGKKNFWRAGSEIVGFNIGLWAWDRYVRKGDYARISFKTIARNFREGFKWDNDNLPTNTFFHPYNGNLYFNAARANGFNFWQSEIFAIGGSAMWEMFMENEYPSTNDIIATPIGGAAIGEVMFRASDAVIDDRSTGGERFGRELACFVISPLRGVNRIITGQAWKHRTTSGRLFGVPPFAMRMSTGVKMMDYFGKQSKLTAGYVFQLDLEYGDRFELSSTTPYNYFAVRTELQSLNDQPVISRLSIKGRLLSREFLEAKRTQASIGIYQHFDYYDSDTIRSVGKVPYKLGIPASVGGGVMFRDQLGKHWRFDAIFHANGVILGSVLSDYFELHNRNYNWASGFSLKFGANVIGWKDRLSISLTNEYYRLFSWIGYRYGTDLATSNYKKLNVQGDRSTAFFNVFTARADVRLWQRLFACAEFTKYVRHTRYRDYDNVHALTSVYRIMLAYKF